MFPRRVIFSIRKNKNVWDLLLVYIERIQNIWKRIFFVLDNKSEKRDDEGIRYMVLNETRKDEKQGAMEYAYHV